MQNGESQQIVSYFPDTSHIEIFQKAVFGYENAIEIAVPDFIIYAYPISTRNSQLGVCSYDLS
jgi:hypothetical protein